MQIPYIYKYMYITSHIFCCFISHFIIALFVQCKFVKFRPYQTFSFVRSSFLHMSGIVGDVLEEKLCFRTKRDPAETDLGSYPSLMVSGKTREQRHKSPWHSTYIILFYFTFIQLGRVPVMAKSSRCRYCSVPCCSNNKQKKLCIWVSTIFPQKYVPVGWERSWEMRGQVLKSFVEAPMYAVDTLPQRI